MASSYNARPLPPEVLVDHASWSIVQERVTVQDLLARQHLPPWLSPSEDAARPSVATRAR
jgi:diaminopimelate decarboxylase